jgi:hypothetical protein
MPLGHKGEHLSESAADNYRQRHRARHARMAEGQRLVQCLGDGCGRRVANNNKSGYCKTCYGRLPGKPCKNCGKRVRRDNISGYCKGCSRFALAANMAARRAWLGQLKVERGCIDCGYRAHPGALDWDHNPGRGPKLFNIAANVTTSMARLLAELAKCDVRCANCHRIKTAERGTNRQGTAAGPGLAHVS